MQMGMKGHGMMRGGMDDMPCTMIKDTAMMQKSMIMANPLPEMDQYPAPALGKMDTICSPSSSSLEIPDECFGG